MSKINISLTDFVDFVSKAGSPKLTKVREVKKRPPYHPSFDFWKLLRDQIIEYHRKGNTDKKKLDKILSKLTDKKKLGRYPQLIKTYKSFLGKKKINYFKVKSSYWVNNDLRVRINPEVGLSVNGEEYIVKYYFKADKLAINRVEIILLLLEESYMNEVAEGKKVAILDIPNKKLIALKTKKNLMPLLKGEAINFESIWKTI